MRHSSAALGAFLKRAGSRAALLNEEGFPTRRVEAWRYTPLRHVSETAWSVAEPIAKEMAQARLATVDFPDAAGRIVFGNGAEIPALSFLPPTVKREKITTPQGRDGHFSAVLNAALGREGLSIRVPAGVDAGRLILVSLSQGEDISTHMHHRIVLEEGASLTLLDVSIGEGRYLSNPYLDILCEKNARLHHVKYQAEDAQAFHLAMVRANIAEHGDYNSFTLNRGAALARHEVLASLEGRQGNVHVNGVQYVDGTRLNDLTSMIHHAAPDCVSRQTVKTVLSDAAQGVFQGKIFVDPVAQKTDGYQMNQALLLSERALINSKPELEIYADDVKCSHGATVGALDDEQLFYLRSRGVPEKEARDMLIRAFLTEALDLVTDDAFRSFLLQGLNL